MSFTKKLLNSRFCFSSSIPGAEIIYLAQIKWLVVFSEASNIGVYNIICDYRIPLEITCTAVTTITANSCMPVISVNALLKVN